MNSHDHKHKHMNKWGKINWNFIHNMAVHYDKKIINEYIYFFKILLLALLKQECEKCAKHYEENIKSFPIENYLKDANYLFLWTYLLHDMVNKRITKETGIIKESPDYNAIKNYYFSLKNPVGCENCKIDN